MLIKTFEEWLIKQKEKDTDIGDLAKDWVKYCNERKPFASCISTSDEKLTFELLEKEKSCRAAFHVYWAAKTKYQKYCNRMEHEQLIENGHKSIMEHFAKTLGA
jgi:hypothetical protein